MEHDGPASDMVKGFEKVLNILITLRANLLDRVTSLVQPHMVLIFPTPMLKVTMLLLVNQHALIG